MKKVLAICGSTRENSTNHLLIHAIAELAKDKFQVLDYNEIARLPHFNPDLDQDPAPPEIIDFRTRLTVADGIMICTPEYAMGVPGSLKNAIDWTVSSMEFSKKPTALITASSLGQKGHASLLETLKIIEANVKNETQLVISHIKTKISKDGVVVDPSTLDQLQFLIESFSKML